MNNIIKLKLKYIFVFLQIFGLINENILYVLSEENSTADTDKDTVVITIQDPIISLRSNSETNKQFHFPLTSSSSSSALNEANTSCQTSKGTLGYCSSFQHCYPNFKLPSSSNLTTIWEAWLLGNYDTCTYLNSNGRHYFGICCTTTTVTKITTTKTPSITTTTTTAPARTGSTIPSIISSQSNQIDIDATNHLQKLNFHEQSKDSRYQNWPLPIPLFPHYPFSWQSPSLLPIYEITTKRNPIISVMQWPPPIPTHPPDHHYPTHPSTTTTTTTATTKNPNQQQPSGTTIIWPPPIPTHPSSTPSLIVTTSTTTTNTPPTQSSIDDSSSSNVINDFQASCGAKNGILDQERIVGGQNASPNEWPWVVAIFDSGRQFCGGSLIDSVHILTAAHCVAHMTSWDVARLKVHLGDHNIRSNNEVHHIERKIKRVVRHRGFTFSTLYNDVALLTLDQPVKFSQTIRPVCLPAANTRQYSGKIGTVTGWGSLRENGPQPAILQKVSVPIWSNQQCAQKYGSAAPAGIINSMICAGKAAKDSCSGDSGGPLVVNEGSRWVQVGIVSWGIGCGKGQFPGVYTRVSSFIPWIMKNLNMK